MSTRRGVPGTVIRDALTQLLARQPEPASVRDLVTAVYHLTGDDRVSYGNVTQGLKDLRAQGLVERVDRGYWQAVR